MNPVEEYEKEVQAIEGKKAKAINYLQTQEAHLLEDLKEIRQQLFDLEGKRPRTTAGKGNRKPRSPETIEKMRAAAKARWAAKKKNK